MIIRSLVIVACFAGCNDEKAAGIKYVVDSARRDLPTIKAAVASPKPGRAMVDCAADTANFADLKNADAKLAGEIDQLCNHDLWAAEIRVGVEAAEAARKAKPTEEILMQCFNPELAMAQDEIKKANRLDDATRALLDRFAKACPDK